MVTKETQAEGVELLSGYHIRDMAQEKDLPLSPAIRCVIRRVVSLNIEAPNILAWIFISPPLLMVGKVAIKCRMIKMMVHFIWLKKG